MNFGTTTSLICPACGQAFLSMQQSMEGTVQCPHCAHHGLRGYFSTQAQVAAVAQVRRRVFQSQPLQNGPAPAFTPAQETPPPASSFFPQPGEVPAAPMVRPVLQSSPALVPVGAPPPPQEFAASPHLRTSPWRNAFMLLGFAAVSGLALWAWWNDREAPMAGAGIARKPSPKVEAPVAPPIIQTQTARALPPPPDEQAFAADAKALVAELFAADTPERRAACIHDAGKYTAEIEGQFGAGALAKSTRPVLTRLSGLPLLLPGGQQVPLFKLVTAACPQGALLRLEAGADGKRRISWPLLDETHAGKLAAFLKQPAAEAAWFHMGLRPSHGLDIPAELRSKYVTFDVQAAASKDPHFVACVERDSPLGRFMDRETEWGRAYLACLLVRRLDIQSATPCLLVIDCGGAQVR